MKQFSRAFLIRLAATVCGAVLMHAADESGKPLPSAKEILERYASAIGGKEIFRKHQSQHAVGTVQMPAQQMLGKMEVFAARPNKLLMKVNLPGIGESLTGFDGKVAWTKNALFGTMLMEGKARDQIATQADFDHALHDPADYKTMEVLGIEEFNDDECYKVRLVHRTGFDSIEFFSLKTGLQRGFIATQESPLGPIKATTVVTDYKQFGDLFMPSRISQRPMGIETVMTIEEMSYDTVDPAVFELPDDVKELLKSPAEVEPGGGQTQNRKEKSPSIPAK